MPMVKFAAWKGYVGKCQQYVRSQEQGGAFAAEGYGLARVAVAGTRGRPSVGEPIVLGESVLLDSSGRPGGRTYIGSAGAVGARSGAAMKTKPANPVSMRFALSLHRNRCARKISKECCGSRPR